MKVKPYKFIEHTADLGISVKGKSLKELFNNAALAMFDIIAEKAASFKLQASSCRKVIIKQKADNLEELFINWLNELLSLSATKEVIFEDFKIDNLDEHNLEAIAVGSDMENYKVNTEIKAATYHELKIVKTPVGWLAEVILDV